MKLTTDADENAVVASIISLSPPKQAIVSVTHASDQRDRSGARVEESPNSTATDQGAPDTVLIE
jgi:hypothetical protein